VLADVWDNRSIESMHIKLLETRDVSGRGSLYDTLGTLRDVGQNHLLQIVALLTMARPEAFTSDAIRARRAEALAGLCSHTVNALCRGQYEGYRELDAVHEASDTETYFSLDFTLQAGQWAGTQCTLEAGKALHTKVNEAVITFRPQPRLRDVSGDAPEVCQNVLRIQFAPEQRISLTVWTRTAELTFGLQQQDLTLVDATGEDCASAEAYERVLHDCITGDQTRFVSGDEVDLAWQFITPILEQLAAEPLQTYEAGSAGPQSDVEANQ
jgi:glucose-6-phosphate 1-dehydrogenase